MLNPRRTIAVWSAYFEYFEALAINVRLVHNEIAAAARKASAGFPTPIRSTINMKSRLKDKVLSDIKERKTDVSVNVDAGQYIDYRFDDLSLTQLCCCS